MSQTHIALALEQLTIGETTMINGHLVTRWARDRYTVGRINQARCSAAEAVCVILT